MFLDIVMSHIRGIADKEPTTCGGEFHVTEVANSNGRSITHTGNGKVGTQKDSAHWVRLDRDYVSLPESTTSCEGKTSGTRTAVYYLGKCAANLDLSLRLPDHRTYDACRRKRLAMPAPVLSSAQFAEAVTERVVALSDGDSKSLD
jgi:hypothetical protein